MMNSSQQKIQYTIISRGENINEQKCQQIVRSNSQKLSIFQLSQNKVGINSCKLIAEVRWPYLTSINLTWRNLIRAEGLKYLSEANWPHLKSINLSHNYFGKQGCKQLVRGKWPRLTKLQIWQNYIRDQGCIYLAKGQWPLLIHLDVQANYICFLGYRQLSKGNWPALTSLLFCNGEDIIAYNQQFNLNQSSLFSQKGLIICTRE